MKALISISSFVLIIIVVFPFYASCSYQRTKKIVSINRTDSLYIDRLKLTLIGEQLYPRESKPNNLRRILDEKVLLLFESGMYAYCFYNKTQETNFLTGSFWGNLLPKHLNQSYYNLTEESRYKRIDYTDGPFLTGFYSAEDSIVLHTADLKRFENKKTSEVYVNYCSISDTLFEFNNISVGDSLEKLLYEFHIPDFFSSKEKFNLVLMDATSQINNAWYINFPDHYSNYTNALVLSFEKNKLVRIQYVQSEYVEYIFKNKNILTRDIHYN